MKHHVLKISIFLWFVTTNILVAAAFEAAARIAQFRTQYIIFGIFALGIYVAGWYRRLTTSRDRGNSESIFKYYWRKYLSKGSW